MSLFINPKNANMRKKNELKKIMKKEIYYYYLKTNF